MVKRAKIQTFMKPQTPFKETKNDAQLTYAENVFKTLN